jgi:hypothetical protein
MPTSTDLVTDLPADFEVFGQAVDTALMDLKGGTTGQLLSKNSNTNMDFVWTSPGGSGGYTLISTTTLSGSAVNLTSIPQTYKDLRLVVKNHYGSADSRSVRIRLNNDSATRYATATSGTGTSQTFDSEQFIFLVNTDNDVRTNFGIVDYFDYTNTTSWKVGRFTGVSVNGTTDTNYNIYQGSHIYNQTTAISQINLIPDAGTFSGGTALLYGVN